MFKLQNIQVKLTARYTKVHVISFQRLCRPRPNNHQATVSESAPVKLGMLCSQALDHKFEFGQVQIRNPFHRLHNGNTPNVRTFYCIVIFSQLLFLKQMIIDFLRKIDFNIPHHHIFSVSRISYYHPHMFYS